MSGPNIHSGALIKEDDTVVSLGDLLDGHKASEWPVTAKATNAIATATKAGVAGKSHYVTGIAGSVGVAKILLMELKDESTVIGNFHVHNQFGLTFAKPMKITPGNDAVLTLAAAGVGEVGAVTLMGYTV